jgi:hypothetical protein
MHTINSVRDSVSKLFDVDLSSSKRDAKHFRARSLFYKMCFSLCYRPTYQAIASSVNKNHATVIHSIKTFENNLKFDETMRGMYETLKEIHKVYEGEDDTTPSLIEDNKALKQRVVELESLGKVRMVSDYQEISLLSDLVDRLGDDERFLLLCKLDALYKLNKNKIK